MAGKQTADIVFCMDASGSMSNAFAGVCNHINTLLEQFKSNLQIKWDVRFDFLAYANTSSSMKLRTLNYSGYDVINTLYHNKHNNNSIFSFFQNKLNADRGSFFTANLDEFKHKLGMINCTCDEATGLALDIAADFPFRDSSTCHRIVVLFTDEPIKDGQYTNITERKIMDLAQKYQDKKISLFMVTPLCPIFDTLSQIDKCEWIIDNSCGLENIDFSKLMQTIGKSVSVSQTSYGGINEVKPLFNQDKWKKCKWFGNDGDYWVSIDETIDFKHNCGIINL